MYLDKTNAPSPTRSHQISDLSRRKTRTEIHKGKSIYILDFHTDTNIEKCLTNIRVLANELKGRTDFIRVLIDARGMQYNNYFISKAKGITNETFDALTGNVAIIGVTPLQQIILKGYNFVAKNKLVPFENKEEALNFLVFN